jgi:hypothetical protein
MNSLAIRQPVRIATMIVVMACLGWPVEFIAAQPPADPPAQDLQIEVTKKGLGKEVSLKHGSKEWFMLVEVTPENTVVIRQEKENESYLVDESETHDRPLTAPEVDTIIDDFINSVKTQTKGKRK